jgi:hypothetical protein
MNVFKLFTKINYTLLAIALIFLLSGVNALAFDPNVKINIYNTSDTEYRDQINVVSVKNTNFINFFIDEYT